MTVTNTNPIYSRKVGTGKKVHMCWLRRLNPPQRQRRLPFLPQVVLYKSSDSSEARSPASQHYKYPSFPSRPRPKIFEIKNSRCRSESAYQGYHTYLRSDLRHEHGAYTPNAAGNSQSLRLQSLLMAPSSRSGQALPTISPRVFYPNLPTCTTTGICYYSRARRTWTPRPTTNSWKRPLRCHSK